MICWERSSAIFVSANSADVPCETEPCQLGSVSRMVRALVGYLQIERQDCLEGQTVSPRFVATIHEGHA